MPKETLDGQFPPNEVQALLLACARVIEDFESLNQSDRAKLNALGLKTMDQILDSTRSAKKRLEQFTMGGQVMSLGPDLTPKEEAEFYEKEVIDIPNDKGQPKLKRLMEEFKDILVAEDVAGMVALHTPGAAEHLLYMQPSYSCVRTVPEGFRFFATEKEHGKEGRHKLITGTANMLDLLAEACARPTMIVMDIGKQFEEYQKSKGATIHHYKPVEKDADQQQPDPLDDDEYQFKAVSRVTMKVNPGGKTATCMNTDFYLEVLGVINPEVYTTGGRLPTKEGIRPLTIALAHGLIGNIHHAHIKGWWDSAEHMRFIMGVLEKGFVDVHYPTEGIF